MSIRSVADLWCFGTKNLTRAEVEKQLQKLWDDARAEGVEGEKVRLRKIADILRAHESVTSQTLATLLDSWIDVDAYKEAQTAAREEYEDPTTTIRERLTENARLRTTDNFTTPYPER